MVTIEIAIPVVFVAFFITVVVMAIRRKGEGVASTNYHHDHVAATNVNGLPMNGGFDVLGNPYGFTEND